MRNIIASALAALIVGIGVMAPSAADWPQWRYDANRSAATDENGPAKATGGWALNLGLPDPAYDHQFRMCADVSYAPVAAGGLVFVPSNATDSVTAYDLKTGEEKWRVVTEGPVRFAPVYVDGKVVFGSDDGRLCCVKYDTGELIWKTRVAPPSLPDSRLLINGRLCSRWPVRGGPVLKADVIYVGAGIWPEEGVYVAAVYPNGKVLWRDDSMSYVENGMSDHGAAYDLSLPPHGYLAVIDGKLAVPSGRSLAAWLDPANGKMEPFTCFYSKTNPPRGMWSVFGVRRYSIQGGNIFSTRADIDPPIPPALKDAISPVYWTKKGGIPANEQYVIDNRAFLGADTYNVHGENYYVEPVLTDTTHYASEFATEAQYIIPRGHTHIKRHTYDKIVARDLTRPEWTTVKQRHFAHDKQLLDATKLVFPVVWEMESPLKVLAKGGQYLYAGGENTIAAIAIPKAGESPKIAWQKQVNGYPVNALIADGALVIATDTGHIHAFSDGAKDAAAPVTASTALRPDPTPPRAYGIQLGVPTNPKSSIVNQSMRDLRTRQQFARRTANAGEARASIVNHVVILESDDEKAKVACAQLTKGSLYGRQFHVINAALPDLVLSPHWATQITIASPSALSRKPKATLAAALDLLRPYTGTLSLPASSTHAETLKQLASSRHGYEVSSDDDYIIVTRVAPPEGAADWTHEMSGADNSFCGDDTTVKWPLGVLWYSGDIDRYYTPATHYQHERNPHALVSHGRMFIITGHFLHCVDIYTGSYLWKRELPLTPWLRALYFDSRAGGRLTERSLVTAEDEIYIVTGKDIQAYDTATGEPTHTLTAPEELRAATRESPYAPEVIPYKGKGVPTGWAGDDFTVQTAPEWTGVRLSGDLIFATVGPKLVAVDRRAGDVRWSRRSTLELTSFVLGDGKVFGLDFIVPDPKREARTAEGKHQLFALNAQSGEPVWQCETVEAPLSELNPRLAKPWNTPFLPKLAVNAKHGLLIANLNARTISAHRVDSGDIVWSGDRAAGGYRGGHMVVTDDHLLVNGLDGFRGYLLDVTTGERLGDDTGIPAPRTCADIVGSNNLLTYRDAATEIYDIESNQTIGINSVRSGCTTSFFAAGGLMNAPMLGHGCVCNYPMFTSLAMSHLPWIEEHRPAIVKASWKNEIQELRAATPKIVKPPVAKFGPPVDVSGFRAVDATIESISGGVCVKTLTKAPGYAIKKLDKPTRKATFTFNVTRAPVEARRHGNAFFVFGPSANMKQMVECRLYYGGRSSVMIVGSAEEVDVEMTFTQRDRFIIRVTVDLDAGTVTMEAQGKKIESKLTGSPRAITYYGFGGANSDNIFSGFTVE